ncbi:MAG TPA: N-6 DNA methylase [Pirellulales bacterium]|nr:N-6 DNA methylase [Pirellulales bacterium]
MKFRKMRDSRGMPVTFKSESQRRAFSAIVQKLRAIGYSGDLLVEGYRFGDWFAPSVPERLIPAAAFGQTPTSYDSALFGVVLSNGLSGKQLVSQYRALGAPIIFEVSDLSVREWAIGRDERAISQISELSVEAIESRFAAQAADWAPAYFMRAKNVGQFTWSRQLDLFPDLLPELEAQIEAKLSPMLRDAMSAATAEYMSSSGHEPDPEKLFKLVFWLLTGKVFRDRDITGFRTINETDGADVVLTAVAKHYRQSPPQLLNRQTRDLTFSRLWSPINFRNLSVDVLAQIWSKSLVTEEVRKRLGIHKTPRAVAKYLVDQIEFENIDDDHKTILEPCCGSAVFLIAAMHRLRSLQWGLSSRERHQYFTRHLVGYEIDPFGAEISRLALTLADFPNPNGWQINGADVFADREMFAKSLQSAGVVLCNPPFEAFTAEERASYNPSAKRKPVQLLQQVLDNLHPHGVLGFVLPQNILDGREYKHIRQLLAQRFASIEITSLPDQAFEADHEVSLLVAQRPIPHLSVAVRHRKVADTRAAWHTFETRHEVTSAEEAAKSVNECAKSIAVPELSEVWQYLGNLPKLMDSAELHRGIEWSLPLTIGREETGNRRLLTSSTPKSGFMLGVPPESNVFCFCVPELKYLDVQPNHQRGNAWKYPWHLPKVMLNAITKSRRGWRIAAFADQKGLVCYQNLTAAWPVSYDIFALAATLNSPIANAFVATREGKRHITIETLYGIPLPAFSSDQTRELRALIEEYQRELDSCESELLKQIPTQKLDTLLKRIDAVVLEAYDLPPRMERSVLDYFNDQPRAVPFEFTNYFPANFDSCFSLKQFLSDEFRKSTVEHFRRTSERLPDHILRALSMAARDEDNE